MCRSQGARGQRARPYMRPRRIADLEMDIFAMEGVTVDFAPELGLRGFRAAMVAGKLLYT